MTPKAIKEITKLDDRNIRRVFEQIETGRNFNMKRGRKTKINNEMIEHID